MNEQFKVSPEQTLLREIRELKAAVQSNTRSSIPVFEVDPPAELGIRLWMLVDGRLRSRRPDGIVMEYATTTPKADVSADPFPVGAYEPISYIYDYNSDWRQSYKNGGVAVLADGPSDLVYGYRSTMDGEVKAMMHFPNLSELAPGVDGTIISKVQLYVDNRFTTLATGTPLNVGTHNEDTAPSTFVEVDNAVATILVPKIGASWYTLPNSVGEALRDGTITGLTFNQDTSDASHYGYAASTKLRIQYTK